MTGEYEPNDSRNVTGTGASQDGRWTNQDGKTPDAAGQPQQQGSQSGQQGGTQPSGAGQQGAGYAESGQQRQFEQSGGQMGSGSSTGAQFAEQIREDMKVCGPDGEEIGTVDAVEGERIKLTKADSSDGEHHYIELSQVDGIEGDTVRLSGRGDTQFGMNAE